jgi:hypothetical protein
MTFRGSYDLSALFADAPHATNSCRRDTSEGGIYKSEIQHPDAILHFTHVSEDSTKLTKAETSSESTPSAILNEFFFSASEISLNEGLSLGFADSPESIHIETNRNKSWIFKAFTYFHWQFPKFFSWTFLPSAGKSNAISNRINANEKKSIFAVCS